MSQNNHFSTPKEHQCGDEVHTDKVGAWNAQRLNDWREAVKRQFVHDAAVDAIFDLALAGLSAPSAREGRYGIGELQTNDYATALLRAAHDLLDGSVRMRVFSFDADGLPARLAQRIEAHLKGACK